MADTTVSCEGFMDASWTEARMRASSSFRSSEAEAAPDPPRATTATRPRALEEDAARVRPAAALGEEDGAREGASVEAIVARWEETRAARWRRRRRRLDDDVDDGWINF